jgi:hypothetical protein
MSASIIAMKMYVGTLNTMPDSRTPRRFTSIRRKIAAMHKPTVCEMSNGYAEVIAAMPLEIDTATVRM